MKPQDEFAAYIVELLAPLGRVTARRMFGGHGIYCDGLMFGLIADEVLYLKVDDGNAGEFDAADLEAFTYEARGKRTAMSYRRAPEQAIESPAEMLPWARSAYAAALRQANAPRRKRRTH